MIHVKLHYVLLILKGIGDVYLNISSILRDDCAVQQASVNINAMFIESKCSQSNIIVYIYCTF